MHPIGGKATGGGGGEVDVPAAKQAWEHFQPAIAALNLRSSISAVTGEGIGTLLDKSIEH
jgi:hypothetical protein